MLADTFIVLGLGKDLIVLTICQDEYTTLDAAHEFFNDHAAGCIAEHTTQHILEFFLRFVEGGENQHTLACTETVSLQYIGSFKGFQELQTFLQMLAIECLITGCGNVVTLHETLRKVFRTFEYGTCLGWSDNGNVLRAAISLQLVVDAFDQGILRAYDHHVDVFLHAEGLDGLEVVGLHGDVFATVTCTGVTWCNV